MANEVRNGHPYPLFQSSFLSADNPSIAEVNLRMQLQIPSCDAEVSMTLLLVRELAQAWVN
jgi:hypothetical protein